MENTQKNKAVGAVSILVIAVGLLVVAGWLFNVSSLERIIPGFIPMKMNTAICFVFLGTALLITQLHFHKTTALVSSCLLWFVAITGLLTFSEFLFHFNAGIDQFLIRDNAAIGSNYPYPGRMAANTALCFLLCGTALAGLGLKKPQIAVVCQYLLHTVTVISSVAIVGYLYSVSLFYRILNVSAMAVHTAILLFLLSITATLLNPQLGVTKLFTGNGVGNLMARRQFIALTLMTIVFGSLRLQSEHFQLISNQVGISLLAIAFLVVCLIITWNMANWLNRVDVRRSVAETEVKLVNAQLEQRVQERSSQLFTLLEKLQKSEEQYRSLFQQASDSIYILDFEGNFKEVNDSMCTMVTYAREELLSMNVADLMDPELLINYPLIYPLIKPGESMGGERKFKAKDGRLLDVDVNIKKFSDDRVLVIARDITDRKKMEAELKHAELRFRTLADKSIVGIYFVQREKFVYVNPRFAEIFGYEPNELIGKNPVDEIIHPDYQVMSNEYIRKRISGEVDSVHYEAMGKRKDFSYNWVEFYGSTVMVEGEPTIIGSIIDITKRKIAENEVRLSEAKYKLLFDSNPLPMWMIAKKDLSVIAANEAAAKLYGYSREEFLKMTVTDMRLEDDMQQVKENYKIHLTESRDMGISGHIKKDGSIMLVQVIANDIVFEGREVRLVQTNDVTEKIRWETAHQKSEANLQTILNNTDTAYALLDPDLNVLEYNKQAINFAKDEFNFELEGSGRIADQLPEGRSAEIMQNVTEVLKGNTISYEVNYPTADGANCWYYVRMLPIANKENEILGLMLAATNVTERKDVEQNLRLAYARIQKHINSIQEMTWKQSHLIRSPLANLKALIPLVQSDPNDEELLNFMKAELDRMDTAIIEMAAEATDNGRNN